MTIAEKPKTVQPRSAARLAAVQALYQLAMTPSMRAKQVVVEFQAHRFGQEVEGALFAKADEVFFADLVEGVAARQEEIDGALAQKVDKGWPLHRLDNIMLSILRAGAYELLARADVPTAVIINEYLEVAHAFETDGKFVNGVLDRFAKSVRSATKHGSTGAS